MNITSPQVVPFVCHETPIKRQRLSKSYHPIFEVQNNNKPNRGFNIIDESYMIKLCRAKKWLEIYHRCHQFSFECIPIFDGALSGSVNVYKDTALGIACQNFDKDGKNEATYNEMFESIKALYFACKMQIRCGQGLLGFTPLMDAITNPGASLQLIKFLIEADIALGEGPEMALLRKDQNGLSPLDHLINSVHKINHSGTLAVEAIRYIIKRCAQIDKNESFIHSCRGISPLILLLSHKVKSIYSSTNDEDYDLNHDRIRRIIECAKILLEEYPNLIHSSSVMSKCTPLHMALRNNLGDHIELIELLVNHDPEGSQSKTRNKFGDMPIHVAVCVGASTETLRILLSHILTTNLQSPNGKNILNTINQPSLNIWAQTPNGFTPIHLHWMRQVDRRLSYPLIITNHQNSGRLNNRIRSRYAESLSQAAGQINDLIKKLPKNHRVSDRENAAKQVLGTFWEFLVLYLKTVHYNIKTKSFINKKNIQDLNNIAENDFFMLHAICTLPHNLPGPKLPLELFYIALMVYPEQIMKRDRYGRTALHYASVSALMNGTESNKSYTAEEHRVYIQKPFGWDTPDSTRFSISVPIIEYFGVGLKEQLIRNPSQIDVLTKLFPRAASLFDKDMFLPVHFAIESEKKCAELSQHYSSESKIVKGWGRKIKKVLFAYPSGLDKRNPYYLCYPFMQAALSPTSSLDTIYSLLRMSPNLVDTGIQ